MANPSDDDEELIAYLDGELDEETSSRVEARLASDPKARRKAAEYKKTFDLLEYLPKSEPSANFASRTITKLQPNLNASGSQQFAIAPRPSIPWLGIGLVLLALVAGFGIPLLLRSPAPTKEAEVLPISDLPLVERLPFYNGVEDLEFLRALDAGDVFESEWNTGKLPERREPLATADRTHLSEQFSALAPVRQQQVRALHSQLNDPSTPNREALLQTLDDYALWLHRLPEGDRKRVLEAAPTARLEVVQELHEKQWREGLPLKQREALKHVASQEERNELREAYREQEKARRAEWLFFQKRREELSGKNGIPWPFNEPVLVKQIDDYLKSGLGVDWIKIAVWEREKKGALPEECRPGRDEVLELKRARESASGEGGWFVYGARLYALSTKYPALPKPRSGEPITKPNQLVRNKELFKEGFLAPKLRASTGKWPDFALELTVFPKFDKASETLGPARPEDFPEPIRDFVLKTLDDADRKKLEPTLGKWPQYPLALLELAKAKNLSIPDIMLPGEPKKWKEYYGLGGKK